MHEYLITVGAEVELFWKRKITGASILFLTNRYLVLFYNLSLLRDLWPFTLSVSFFSRLPRTLLIRALAAEVHYFLNVGRSLLILSSSSCGQWANGTRVVEILCYVPWGGTSPDLALMVLRLTQPPAFSALRVFALTNRNWFLALIVFLLSMAPVGVNFVSTATCSFKWNDY